MFRKEESKAPLTALSPCLTLPEIPGSGQPRPLLEAHRIGLNLSYFFSLLFPFFSFFFFKQIRSVWSYYSCYFAPWRHLFSNVDVRPWHYHQKGSFFLMVACSPMRYHDGKKQYFTKKEHLGFLHFLFCYSRQSCNGAALIHVLCFIHVNISLG